MYGTHATNCRETGRVRRWPGRIKDAGGSRTHVKLLCRQPHYRLAPAPNLSVSSPGVEPRAPRAAWSRPSQGRVRSATLREHSHQRPAEESNPGTVRSMVGQFRGLPCDPAHPQGLLSKSLDQDSDLDLDLRRVLRVRCAAVDHAARGARLDPVFSASYAQGVGAEGVEPSV